MTIHRKLTELSAALLAPQKARSACPHRDKHFGAGGRTRTDTGINPKDFESFTSTNSITPAYGLIIIAQSTFCVKNFFEF